MEGVNNDYLGKHKKFRLDSKKLAALFFISAFIVAIIVFWWLKLVGITITGDTFCSVAEHSHSDECYISELVCGFDETSTNSSVVDETTAQLHAHSDGCYQKTLVCTKTEHTHSQACFSDKTADVETVSDWLKTLEDVEITNNIPENLVAVAMSQKGYEESQKNFEYDSDGDKKGYTRYGEWYGNPYGNWNAMFVSFCLNYSNVKQNDSVFSSNVITMYQQWQEEGLVEAPEGHEGRIGELLFLDMDVDGVVDCVSVISEITGGEIKGIIGDFNNRVEEVTIDNPEYVIGYGLTYNLMADEETAVNEENTAASDETEKEAQEEADKDRIRQALADNPMLTEEEIIREIEKEKYYSQMDASLKDAIEKLPDEDKALVIDVIYSIEKLPTADVFIEAMDAYYENDDTEGEQEYYFSVQQMMVNAYARYQGAEHLSENIFNADELFKLKDLYNNQMFTTGTSSAVTFNYVNRGWSNVAPIIITGGSAREVISTGNNPNVYWSGIVVDYDDEGYYYVSHKYQASTSSDASDVLDIEPSTSKGFVMFIWSADTNATTTQKNAADVASAVAVGDRVNISTDPYKLSAGYSSSGYGTVTFSEYVPPVTPPVEPDEPNNPEGSVVEDIPVSDIADGELSDSQVIDAGGKTTSAEGDVEISKSIDGTDIENVFDITLTVRTESSMQTYLADPDMAVVIVMDISNTMNSKYPAGSTTSRYDAAVVAAENFINQFASKGKGISKLGFVAFNTHAHEILPLQKCTTSNASSLISEMKSETGSIINASGYADAWTRFTNIEAGLKMGYDMLANAGNENKYIVFLSDGFPTTYIESGYNGYDPNDESGTRFYDSVELYNGKKRPCSYGTSYSDEAAIRARKMATNIKNLGATVFSIGVNVSGQSIASYVNSFAGKSFTVVDRRTTAYEIGSESQSYENNMTAFENWLKYSIGSSYYYDSKNQTEITQAFNKIFTEIENLNKESRETIWTTTDPLPVLGEDASVVEFINFFDKDGKPVYDVNEAEGFEYLDGEFGVGKENTAFHKKDTIYWDLKDSGYRMETSEDGNTTYFYYQIKYRIRLFNENQHFVEYTDYNTNGNAFLEYKTITVINGETTVSDNKKLYFEKPAVEGYYEDFVFYKQSALGEPLEGAVFTLTHDDVACSVCHGNGEPVTSVSTLGPFTSAADGSVTFSRIPSGHIYSLEETIVPEGYIESEKIFKVTVKMNELSIRIYESEEDTVGTLWSGDEDFIFINQPYVYILPETGGPGTLHLAIIGFVLTAAPILYSIIHRKRKRRLS